MWCQRERRTLRWERAPALGPNAGSCWVDDEKLAELVGANGEKWKSVQEKWVLAFFFPPLSVGFGSLWV
jgi:hypothetical protein